MKTYYRILAIILIVSLLLAFSFEWKAGFRGSDIWPGFIFFAVIETVIFLANFFICEFFAVYDLARKTKGLMMGTGAVLCFLLFINYLTWFRRVPDNNIEATKRFWENGLNKNPFQYQAIKAVVIQQSNPNAYRLIEMDEEKKDTLIGNYTMPCRQETQLYNLGENENSQTMHFNRQLVFGDSMVRAVFDVTAAYAMAHPEIPEYARLLKDHHTTLAMLEDLKNGDTMAALKHAKDLTH